MDFQVQTTPIPVGNGAKGFYLLLTPETPFKPGAVLILDYGMQQQQKTLPLGTLLGYPQLVLAELWKPSSSGCTTENKAIPLSPCPGQHPGIPCWHLLPWACSHVPGHASSCSSDPQSHGSCPWPAPCGCASPLWLLSGTGSELDAALPGVRQVRTDVLRGCRNSV